MKPRQSVPLSFCLVVAATASATADSRIAKRIYDPNGVVELSMCMGFQTTIVFAEDETIENVALGDSARFLAIANRNADALFIKPVMADAQSNMTVLTTQRDYNFLLVGAPAGRCPSAHQTFSLSFEYSEEATLPLVGVTATDQITQATGPADEIADVSSFLDPADHQLLRDSEPTSLFNRAYFFEGDQANVPLRVFDDGRTTSFFWPEGVATPVIFAIDATGGKSLVNYNIRDGLVLVDQVAPRFELRRGDSVTLLINQGFVVPKLDEQSPQPISQADSNAADSKTSTTRSIWPFGRKEDE